MRKIKRIIVTLALLGASGGLPVLAEWSDAALNGVLSAHVDDLGRVDYEGLSADTGDLDRYVAALGRTSPDSDPALFATESDRLAYWMNAYNALMLHRVVAAWPVESVRDIRAAYGVFWMERHTLGGERFTLRGLENKIIRDRFGDPRIHFAINCASAGCPALPRRAWRADDLDAELDAAARRFIRDSRNVRLDSGAAVVHLSSIFKWFRKDFTGWMKRSGVGAPHGLLDYVVRYLPEAERRDWPLDQLSIEWIPYDWSINARP